MPRNLERLRAPTQTGMQAAQYGTGSWGLASTESNHPAGSNGETRGEGERKQGNKETEAAHSTAQHSTVQIHMDKCGAQPNIPLHSDRHLTICPIQRNERSACFNKKANSEKFYLKRIIVFRFASSHWGLLSEIAISEPEKVEAWVGREKCLDNGVSSLKKSDLPSPHVTLSMGCRGQHSCPSNRNKLHQSHPRQESQATELALAGIVVLAAIQRQHTEYHLI
ncbi:hypothetical protein SNK03_008371 [Fusarium graminearum]